MGQSIERNNLHRAQNIPEPSSEMSSWSILLLTSIILLLLLILSTYTFNWTWTGFRNNTLWDWLQLLVLPVVLTSVTVWFSTHKRWTILWTWLIALTLVALIICAFGGYFLNWTWTGFHNNTLWDWLKLLVLPTVLTAVSIWFSTHMNELSDIKQGTSIFRQSTFVQGQANRHRQSPPAREVEYNDSTVLIRHPKPVQRIHQDIGDSAENLEKPVDNEPEI